MHTNTAVESRNEIARAALDGDPRYSHEAVGAEDGDINGMAQEIGMPLVHRAASESDVAVYASDDRWVLVADANGPVAIRMAAAQTVTVELVHGTVGGFDPMDGTWRVGGLGDRDLAVVLGAISSKLAELGVDYGVDVTLYHADGRSITDDLPSDGRWLALRL